MKKQFLRKSILAVTAVSMITWMFTGCGGAQDKTKSSTQSAAKASSTAVNAGSTSQPGSKIAGKITFAAFDYEKGGYDPAIVEGFKKAYPDVQVEVLDIPANEYSDKLTVSLSGGSDIDVFLLKDPSAAGGLVAKKQLMPLNEFQEKEPGVFSAPEFGSGIKEYTVDGKIYAIPYRLDYYFLYYNKDVFDAAGVKYPSNNMTWPEYRETAKKLSSGQGTSRVYGAYFYTWAHQFFQLGFEKGFTNVVDGDYELLKDGLTMVKEMMYDEQSAMDYPTVVSTGAGYKGVLQKGAAAMMYQGTWLIQQLDSDAKKGVAKVNWGIAKLPTWSGKGDCTYGMFTGVGMNPKTKNKAAAWEFLKFYTGEKGAGILAGKGNIPAYRNTDIMNAYISNLDLPEGARELLLTPPETIHMTAAVNPLSTAVNKMVTEELQMLLTNNTTVDNVIANMKTRRNEIITQNK
jgi:multiple sugar transport system substrate-binding protein